jgi:hypothetical protein
MAVRLGRVMVKKPKHAFFTKILDPFDASVFSKKTRFFGGFLV